jgi:hypothetical protein
MRWTFVWVVLAACSSTDIPGTVTITNARCTNPSATGYTLDADFEVMMEVDEEVQLDAEPTPNIGPSSAMVDDSWSCAEWGLVDDDGDGHSLGCHREVGQTATATVSVHSVSVYSLGALPTPLRIEVSATLVDAQRGDDKATTTIDCP